MPIRKFTFAPGEYYHCYNRGVDKRVIFTDSDDYSYFLRSLRAYNTSKVSGKLRLNENREAVDPPVTILAYCLLPNHFHLLLRCNTEAGIGKYLQRVSGGYTMYFNQKDSRSGSLFQGKFKASHIESDQDLRQTLAYVAHNHLVHNISDPALYRSSINTRDTLVRGLASNFTSNFQVEVVDIIKTMRQEGEFSQVRGKTSNL